MEPSLKEFELRTGTWDDEHVKALLHFPRFPIRLIQHEPWQTWIGQRGGLKAVYAYLQNYPLPPTHRRILDVVLSTPEAVADVYADRLNISRATYFYQLRELVPALAQALNHWELDPAPATIGVSSSSFSKPPVPINPLIGAEATLQSLTRLLIRDDVRLISLLGPGGIGKTRLSLELAHAINSNLCFVDLSETSDPAQVSMVISRNLGLKDGEISTLKTYLSSNEFLLILDNFEQILPARIMVANLLAAAPRLKILVTSRAALNIYGEHQFVVPPLGIPDVESVKDQQLWAKSPAVALFLHSAQAVRPAFGLTNENVEAIAELCRCLDGLPLAIELAAYQVKYYSPQAILAHLSNSRLIFLGQVPKRTQPHQRTLRGMLEWSFDLLPPDLQVLFCRVAVFSGGCTIEAAERVCSRLDAQVGLTSLTEHSLLEQRVETNGEPRFHMLGITREFALERLSMRGEVDSLKRIHALYYLQLAEHYMELENTNLILEREQENINTAIQWTIDQHEEELGLRFVSALWGYWLHSVNIEQGRQLAQLLLDRTNDLQVAVRERVLELMQSILLPSG
jgi:predicted ATPase